MIMLLRAEVERDDSILQFGSIVTALSHAQSQPSILRIMFNNEQVGEANPNRPPKHFTVAIINSSFSSPASPFIQWLGVNGPRIAIWLGLSECGRPVRWTNVKWNPGSAALHPPLGGVWVWRLKIRTLRRLVCTTNERDFQLRVEPAPPPPPPAFC